MTSHKEKELSNKALGTIVLLETALSIACGELSTYRENDHPEVVMNQVLHQAEKHLMEGE